MPSDSKRPVRYERTAQKIPSRPEPWYVNIPFQDLNKLVNQLETLDEIKQDNAQLCREVDGLRNLYSELLTVFGDLRRELKGR